MEKLVDKLEKKYDFNSSENSIGSGFYAKVYRLNSNKAVKIPIYFPDGDTKNEKLTSDDSVTLKLEKEFETHKYFYDFFKDNSEINIVKPYGIYALKNLQDERYYPGIVMDFLDGKRVSELKEYKEKGIDNLTRKQWKIANEKGIFPLEFNLENAIWVSKEEKVYLIDLDNWRFMNEKELKKFKNFYDKFE
jgi:hypothetical protein